MNKDDELFDMEKMYEKQTRELTEQIAELNRELIGAKYNLVLVAHRLTNLPQDPRNRQNVIDNLIAMAMTSAMPVKTLEDIETENG